MASDVWGIDDGYWDIAGQWHETPEQTRQALRVAMGGLADVADPPPATRPVWFVRQGNSPSIDRPAELALEDGTRLDTATDGRGISLTRSEEHTSELQSQSKIVC